MTRADVEGFARRSRVAAGRWCLSLVIAGAMGGLAACGGSDEMQLPSEMMDPEMMDPEKMDPEQMNPDPDPMMMEPDPEPTPEGLPVLGRYSHAVDGVDVQVIATQADGLNFPRDLAFSPLSPDQLWIVNYVDSSIVVLQQTGTPQQTSSKHNAFGNTHFLAKPGAIAFGDNGLFATAQEEDQITQATTPADFMGPTLWTSDLNIFDGGHGGHMDMLHNSPNSNGIAWEQGNVYWVFDGYHRSITRYDFADDHGPGGADHSDGITSRYVEGQVGYERGVPSHMELDRTTGILYAADTANARIVTLDINTGTRGRQVPPNYDGVDQHRVSGAEVATFIDGATIGLVKPSGLALRDGILYVGDNGTSMIMAFSMETGELLDWLPLNTLVAQGGLMGLDFDADGRLHLVDCTENRVIRISAK